MAEKKRTYDEIIQDRHCTCSYRTVTTSADFVGDRSGVALHRDTTGCHLHDPDPRHDLPAEVR